MVRKLKTHEQKLLKKTDFMSWQVDQQGRQGDMLRKCAFTAFFDFFNIEENIKFFH